MTKAFSLHMKDTPSFSVKHVEQRVVLNYVRIQSNSNKFYIMELQEGAVENSYRIYIEYGRLGRFPRRHVRYFLARLEAKSEFEKILTSKRKKGYELILIEDDWDDFSYNPFEKIEQTKTSQPISPFPTSSIHSPLGQLSDIQLHRGFHILTQLEENIHNGGFDVLDLSNQFFSVIPIVLGNQIDESYLLDTKEKVQAKKAWLNQLITTY
jgi:predicted DNA-binding WGR domain protein